MFMIDTKDFPLSLMHKWCKIGPLGRYLIYSSKLLELEFKLSQLVDRVPRLKKVYDELITKGGQPYALWYFPLRSMVVILPWLIMWANTG